MTMIIIRISTRELVRAILQFVAGSEDKVVRVVGDVRFEIRGTRGLKSDALWRI